MDHAETCPRCGGPVRAPDMMISSWRCDGCGPVPPMHVAAQVGPDVLTALSHRIAAGPSPVPMWCPWPLPPGWLVTGVGWAGDARTGAHATAVACSGPAPLSDGPADIVLVAEEPGVGLGNRFAGLAGADPGANLCGDLQKANGAPPSHDRSHDGRPHEGQAHAKIKAAGHDTPMWCAGAVGDRVAYVGEARGMWLYAIAWPADAAYILSEHIVLHDLVEGLPGELMYGAPSPHLRRGA